MLAKVLKYYHTIKYLKLTQIYGQVTFRYLKPKPDLALPPLQRKMTEAIVPPIVKLSQLTSESSANFLNQEKDISATSIWSDAKVDKLWLYNLHYFDVLNSHDTPLIWQQDLIERWIKENPPATGCGWEPYPISLRLVNWIKWILLGHYPSAKMLHSLAIQARFLSKRIESHLLGNHILANAKALLFAGLFFEGYEAQAWFNRGMKIFKRELSAQILSDGGHFELSPMYHAIILEDLLDIINLFKSYDRAIPADWVAICNNMFNWLRLMCHNDGHISFFNDAAFGVAPTLSELEEYQLRLLVESNIEKILPIQFLNKSGYCRIQKNNILLLADLAEVGASYQPGHAHADTLSFELSVGLQRLIVNSGTSCYTENSERFRQRSSKAHNTVVVDDMNSSEIWKSFRVARRASVRDIEIQDKNNIMTVQARHDGYYHSKKVNHIRKWSLTANELLIEDLVSGSGHRKIEIAFHIHPGVIIKQLTDKSIMFYDQSNNFLASLQMNPAAKIEESTYHPEFNVSIQNKKITTQIHSDLPASLRTSIKFN